MYGQTNDQDFSYHTQLQSYIFVHFLQCMREGSIVVDDNPVGRIGLESHTYT